MIAFQSWRVLGRWGVFVLACVSYGSAAVFSLVLLLAHNTLAVSWSWFLLTTVISLAFFGVGCLVWWYARQRRVAAFFFGVCTSFAFSLLLAVPSEVADPGFFNALSSLSASIGIFFLLFLFLHFPHPFLRSWRNGGWRMRMLWGWLAFLSLLSGLSALYCVTGARVPPASLFEPWYMGYFLATTGSLLGALVVAARTRLSRRERQQFRLLSAGFGLGLAPWICCSVLPDLIHALLPAVTPLSIADSWTIPALLLLPVTLGYTVLRYQFLVFDALVAQAVTWLLRGVGLMLCAYLGLMGFVWCPQHPVVIVALAGMVGGLSIGMWSLANWITTTLLFAEAAQDHQMMVAALETPAQTRDVPTLARSLRHLVTLTCGSRDTFLLMRDQTSGLYRLAEEVSPAAMGRLEQVLALMLIRRYPAPPAEEFSLATDIQTRLVHARRPLFLRELVSVSLPSEMAQMVLTGLAVAGQLVGILVVETRADQQPYAGADLEMVHNIAARVLPMLITSMHSATRRELMEMREEAFRQTALLGKCAPEDVATALVEVLARFLPAQVELWERREQSWLRLAMAGTHANAWSTDQTRRFLSQNEAGRHPLFESEGRHLHPLPFLLLPVEEDPPHASLLLAHYSRPSVFFPERCQILALVASHARRLLQQARLRADTEGRTTPTLSPDLLVVLRSFLTTVHAREDVEGHTVALSTDLQAHWKRMQDVVSPRFHPALSPQRRLASAAAAETVLLVVAQPLLVDVLVRACAWRGNPAVVHPHAQQSLQWLQQAPQRLAAIVLDEEALALDLEIFLHALMEYLPHRPPCLVFPATRRSLDEQAPTTGVTYLSKPFRLEHLFQFLECS